MEKPCQRCGLVTMTDDEHRICYDCFVELDLMFYEEEQMYTNLYVYKAPRLFMSGKLYWRYKKNGRWTWKAARLMSDGFLINEHMNLLTVVINEDWTDEDNWAELEILGDELRRRNKEEEE